MLITVDELARSWGLSPKSVLHVGAHGGEELIAYEARGWGNKRTIWVEGQAELADRLADKLRDAPNHRVIQAVAWDEATTVTFYVTSNSQSSSALPLKLHSEEYPSIVVTSASRVATSRLDELLADDPVLDMGVDFLNLDIQGAELRALVGLGQELAQVGAVYCEVNLVELYEGCATLRPLARHMQRHGFALVDIRLTSARWGDALWLPRAAIPPSRRFVRRLTVESRVLRASVTSAARRALRAIRSLVLPVLVRTLSSIPRGARTGFISLLEVSIGKGFVPGIRGEIDRLAGVSPPSHCE